MGKTGKWIRNFLTGKKDKDNNKHSSSSTNHHHPTNTPVSIPPPSTPKEKRRWSFRRPAAPQTPDHASTPPPSLFESEKHAMAVAVATAAAADAAVAAASAAAAMMRLTVSATGRGSPVQVAAAIKIQSAFRSYLARKALNALKGLVKLQALVRGHLVRKQATATLRCMQALVTVQARARAQRLRLSDEINQSRQHQITPRRNSHSHDNRFRHDVNQLEENIKIVEMDIGQSRSNTNNYRKSSYSNKSQKVSPAPSALTELSPRASSGHFEDFSFGTAQSSPQHYYSAISKPESVPRHDYAESLCYEYSFYPNYMANTESSRAKVRSHSAPKQRPPDSYERQSSVKRRPSIEGRNVPRAVRMQRSSSHVGSTAQNYQYPWSVKLDKSTVSLINSECGSTSTVLTNSHYCKSIAGFDIEGNRY